ncbi:hypothetical protein TNCV_100971 [Trichonephila clavipes]|nr:hypothetical protein TNCV_100971 [Trichonephila clavipes]
MGFGRSTCTAVIVLTNATCLTKSDRDPRNSSLLRARIFAPVVSLSFEHYKNDNLYLQNKKQTLDLQENDESCSRISVAQGALRNAKRLLRDKLRQKRVSILTDLVVGKPWSRQLDGQRRAQLSALSRVWHVSESSPDMITCKPIFFKIGLADSPLCSLCNSVPMTGEHLSDCPALLQVLSQDNCGVLLPARATSALYWTARRLMSERTRWRT